MGKHFYIIGLVLILGFTSPSFAEGMRPAVMISDFEEGTYSGWRMTGTAFGSAPAAGTLSGQQEVSGYSGQFLVNSFLGGDTATGTLTSDTILIERSYICFLLGGGANAGCRMELLSGDKVVYSTTPDVSEERLKWNGWDVHHLAGEKAVIRIVDEAQDGWGHICIDSIVQCDLQTIGTFEGEYSPWTVVSGNAFGEKPATGTMPGQNEIRGWNGEGYVNTFLNGDASTGVLRSPRFVITAPYICFRLGGGMDSGLLHVDLYIDGERCCRATPVHYISRAHDGEQEQLRPRSWDVSQYIGQEAYIEIVDASDSGWGHLCADDFVFSNRPSSFLIDNRVIEMEADRYLQVPTQNWGPFVELTVKDPSGNLYSSQRVRLAHDAVDRYIPLYTGGLSGGRMQVQLSMDYSNSVVPDNMYTSCEAGLEPWEDTYRPLYHHAPAYGWMSDPNGMVYTNGKYHLFYQYYPYDPYWHEMHWGHATSTDLVHWEEHPIALFPDEYGVMYSGSVVVDEMNTAGFGAGAMVAVYTSTAPAQAQSLAYSTDEGMTWHKYGAPVLYGSGDFRDPKVFWWSDRGCWVMIVANGFQIEIYSSSNLKQWRRELGWGGHVGGHGGVWECPDLIQVPVEGTNEMRWVMLVSVGGGTPAGGSGIQYFIGDFVLNDFILHTDGQARWVDFGKDNYAGVTWTGYRDAQRRPVFIGWMNNWQYCNATPYGWSPFRGQNTFPRALSLVQTPDGLCLKSEPVAALDLLRSETVYTPPTESLTDNWQSGLIPLMDEGAAIIEMDFHEGKQSWKLTLRNDSNEYVALGFNAATNEVYLDRQHSGITGFGTDFAVANQVGLLSGDERTQRAMILLDRSSVEFFVNDGRMVLTDLVYPSCPYHFLSLEGGEAIRRLSVTAMDTDRATQQTETLAESSFSRRAEIRCRNGQLYIQMPDGKQYSVLGTLLKP